MRPLIVLLGPTAVGKTALSLTLCRRCAGEILSADSRQIYRGMDIGTAKATPAEQAQAPHHLIDIRNPDQTLTVAEFQTLAYSTIGALHGRARVPFLVGGTALYVRAVTQGLRIPEVPPNPILRGELEATLAAEGLAPLVDQLCALDPATAAAIDLRNPRRVVRALEIFLTTGRSKVAMEGADPPPYKILQIGLTRARASLHARIDARVDAMIADGLVEETRRLLRLYDPALPALSSLGYREIGSFLRGELALAEAVARIKTETHRFVRNQETSFRKLQDVVWFDLDDVAEGTVVETVDAFLHAQA